jgi:homocysteine S-methyltransferase
MMPTQRPSDPFDIVVEVVPPAGHDAGPLLAALAEVRNLPFSRISVATNPVARSRMSALALSVLIQQQIHKPATLHCTTRDHNRLGLQSLLWGARALDIDTVLVATGDYVALTQRGRVTTVRDVDVFDLVQMARAAGMYTGVVLDARPELNRLEHEVRRLENKIEAGAQFVVTQPVYDENAVRTLHDSTRHLSVPISLGVLPLRSVRHARFLHTKVAGIAVPDAVRERLEQAADPVAEGIANARDVLGAARQWFAGACIMPAFNHYGILFDLLNPDRPA